MKMECKECGAEMNIEEALVGKSTHADIDDMFVAFLICEECGHEEPLS